MKCVQCCFELIGSQRKYCSKKCKELYAVASGKTSNFQKRSAYNKKLELVNILGGCCQICGYKKCLRALSFHHIDKSTKKFNISSGRMKSARWSDILEEIKKCMLLCSNCHWEVHSNEDGTYQFIDDGLKPYNRLIKLSKINCKFCNSEFLPNRRSRKYCSKLCSGRNREKYNKPDKETLKKLIGEFKKKEICKMFSIPWTTLSRWIKNYGL